MLIGTAKAHPSILSRCIGYPFYPIAESYTSIFGRTGKSSLLVRPCGLHLCYQRGQQTFFRQFLMVYSRFRSVLFAFRHSLKPVFPHVPRLSVAVYVVRNRCSTCTLRSEPALSQSKKVVKVKSVCPKRPRSNRNLRRWIAPLSTMRRKFYNPSYEKTWCSSLNFYLCLSPF